jgi:hypothetical protein
MGGMKSMARTTVRYAIAISAVAVSLASLSGAHGSSSVPRSGGTPAKGKLEMPLYRGNVMPFEVTVAKTPANCSGTLQLRLSWDEDDNEVRVNLDGKRALTRYPSVNRTEGVDFFPNPFLPEPKDVHNGRNQFWVITTGPRIDFYYDNTTLNLLGSQFDFASPPAGAIPVSLPTLVAVGSPFFQPDHDGDVHFEWKFEYDAVKRGDRPEFSHHYVSFPPPNLCQANPFRFDLSTARPYVSKPQPASAAISFSEFLRGGLLFDTTIDPPSYHVEPPLTTFIATYSGATVIAGNIPENWSMDIEAAFMNVAPPIRPWAGVGCSQYFEPMHTKGLDFCPTP